MKFLKVRFNNTLGCNGSDDNVGSEFNLLTKRKNSSFQDKLFKIIGELLSIPQEELYVAGWRQEYHVIKKYHLR